MQFKNHFWFHKEPFIQRFFKEPSLPYLFIIWRTFFHHKEPFVKQNGSSDVKGSLWNNLDKKVLLWHREAPLFLRVYAVTQKWLYFPYRSTVLLRSRKCQCESTTHACSDGNTEKLKRKLMISRFLEKDVEQGNCKGVDRRYFKEIISRQHENMCELSWLFDPRPCDQGGGVHYSLANIKFSMLSGKERNFIWVISMSWKVWEKVSRIWKTYLDFQTFAPFSFLEN